MAFELAGHEQNVSLKYIFVTGIEVHTFLKIYVYTTFTYLYTNDIPVHRNLIEYNGSSIH